jgi:hypothetical protein
VKIDHEWGIQFCRCGALAPFKKILCSKCRREARRVSELR